MLNVLIVDDDCAIRYDLKRFDKWNDYNFTIASEAEDGYEALELIKKNHYDLIFADIKMPRINGLQFLSDLREQNNNIPVVIMSGYSDFEYTKQSIKLGAFDYLLKPIDTEELCKLLESAQKHIEKNNNKDEIIKDKTKSVLINRICEYIEKNLDKDTNLEAVANHFGYSSKHLGKLFRLHTGEGFVNYITNLKMKKAKELISSGKYKNYEISDLLGYKNPDYFTSLFKKHYGMTVIEYRKGERRNRAVKS